METMEVPVTAVSLSAKTIGANCLTTGAPRGVDFSHP